MSKRRFPNNPAEHRMVRSLDKLAAYERFQELIMPEVIKDLEAGLTAEEIMKKYAHLAAAKLITTAVTGSEHKSTAAAKEILDRVQGKATERKEVTHKLDKLPDDQLDALLLTELEDMDSAPPKESAPKKKRGRPTKSASIAKKLRDNGSEKDSKTE